MNEDNQAVQTTDSATVPQNLPEKPTASRDTSARNLEEMRHAIKEANDRAERAERVAYDLQQKATPTPIEDYEISGDDDALAEFKQLKKIDKKYAKSNKDVLNEVAKLKDYIDEQFVRNKYPDIDQLIEKQNQEKLARQNPALYRSIMSNPSVRDRGEVLAEQIKIMLNTENTEKNKYAEQERRMEERKTIPKPASGISSPASISPIAAYDPNVRITMTADEKKEAQRYASDMKKRQNRTT